MSELAELEKKLKLQREVLGLVEKKDWDALEEIAVREGIDRDLWRFWAAISGQAHSTGKERDS